MQPELDASLSIIACTARPHLDLSDAQLHGAVVDAQREVRSIDRQATELTRVADLYETQATQLEQDATATQWERPAWTRVREERQAETAAISRLADVDDRLNRTLLRGGPRGHERDQQRAEADQQLRSAYPETASGIDRVPTWEQRAETAWAQDTATIQQLRTDAATLRANAHASRVVVPTLADQREQARDRLGQLIDERRSRDSEPRPGEAQPAPHSPFGPWTSLDSGRDDMSRHGPGIDPSQPFQVEPGTGPQRGQGPQL